MPDPKKGTPYNIGDENFLLSEDNINKLGEYLYKKTDGPNKVEINDKEFWSVGLTVNEGNAFLKTYLLSPNPETQRKGVYLLLRALVLTEMSFVTKGSNKIPPKI